MTFPDGRTLKGEFKDSKPQGQGKMTYPGGLTLEGVWVGDEKVLNFLSKYLRLHFMF